MAFPLNHEDITLNRPYDFNRPVDEYLHLLMYSELLAVPKHRALDHILNQDSETNYQVLESFSKNNIK